MAQALGATIPVARADTGTPSVSLGVNTGIVSGSYVGFTSSTQDLTGAGTTDWRIWGNTSTSLSGDARKSSGAGISDLANVAGDPAVSGTAPRALGSPSLGLHWGNDAGTVPFAFRWADGTPTASSPQSLAGLQQDAGSAASLGYGFSFTVPATTVRQRLTIWVDAHHGTGRLTATIGGVTKTDTSITGGENYGGIYTIDYAGDGTASQSMTVSWILISSTGPFDSSNVAIHAAALSPAPDFTIGANPASATVAPGGSTTSTISIASLNGLTGTVALAATASPGLTATLSSSSYGFDSASPTLTVAASADITAGTHTATVTGTLGTAVHSTTVTVTVPSDFSISASPTPVTIASGASGTSTITVAAISGTTGSVNLTTSTFSASLLSASVSTTPWVIGTTTSSTLTITAAPGLLPGGYIVTVTGTLGSDGPSHSTSVTVTVPAPVGVPLLTNAYNPPGTSVTYYAGHISAAANTPYTITFDSAATCPGGVFPASDAVVTVIGSISVTTDGNGNAFFSPTVPANTTLNSIAGVPGAGQPYIAARVTGPGGSYSGFSPCVVNSPDNDTWTRALDITTTGSPTVGTYIDQPGVGRWFKFHVIPGASVTVNLTGLPADYDVYLFKDIAQTYTALTTASLTTLSASSAGSGFAGSGFAGSGFAGSGFAGSGFAGSGFAADSYSGSGFAGSGFAGSGFAGSGFAGSGFAGSGFAGSGFAGSGFAGSGFAPKDFSAAQVYSLINWSNNLGLANEHLLSDTYLSTGDYYIRVNGKNGASNLAAPFTLTVANNGLICQGVVPSTAPAPTPIANTASAVILTDSGRLATNYSASDVGAMLTKLGSLASATNGVVVDLKNDTRVQGLQVQADHNPGCVYAENLVASASKDIVDAYRRGNTSPTPVKYVVLAGGDNIIPYFRYPDSSSIGPEANFYPPVLEGTPSQASLRNNFVLGQDAYGSSQTLSLGVIDFPIPDLAVGRLVKTPTEISGMVQAYLDLNTSGYAVTPHTSLVTGYDFVADDAAAVKGNLDAGTGQTGGGDALISNYGVSPTNTCTSVSNTPLNCSWTASQLKAAFLNTPHDIAFLAGHFSASSALAADFSSVMTTADLAASTQSYKNSIIFSIGCHSGYSIADGAGIAGVTQTLDWAQAFADKQATAILGTGFQYGDTDFIAYSERIYAEFSKQLLYGTGPVGIGTALVASKIQYLKQTPGLGDLHVKALLESALYGLPMLGVNMPNGRTPTPSGTGSLTPGPFSPASPTGLQYADLTQATPSGTHQHTKNLTNLDGGAALSATYYTAPDGSVISEPGAPIIPLYSAGVTSATSGYVLRGIGFRGGAYSDASVIPLTGAPGTEIGTAHTSFNSPVFYPSRLATPNYFGALTSGSGGTTLMMAGAQNRAITPGSDTVDLRLYSSLSFRLFYSNSSAAGSASAPPVIYGITSALQTGGSTKVTAHVTGDPSADIQEVWMTYTEPTSGTWASLDLTRDTVDPTLWKAAPTLLAGTQFMVQAANGFGLTSANDNSGAYYVAGVAPSTPAAGTLTVTSGGSTPTSGVYGSTESVTATLSIAGTPVPNKLVILSLGSTTVSGTTGDGTTQPIGQVTFSIPLLSAAGDYPLTATFLGDSTILPTAGSGIFTITPAASTVIFTCPTSVEYTGSALTPCTAAATGANLNQPLVLTYSANVAVGTTVTATAQFYGDAAHLSSSGSATFTIGKAISTTTVTCSAGPFVYTGSAFTPCSATVTGPGGLNLTPTLTAANYTNNLNAGIGTASASYSYSGDANYSSSSGSATFTIGKATLNVNAVAASRFYGNQDPSLTWTYSGFVGTDTALNVTVTGAASCSRGPGTNVGTYVISCTPGTLSSTNYAFATGAPADLSINQRPITVTAQAASKTADGTPSSSVPPIVTGGIAAGDTTGSLIQTYVSSAAGTGILLTPSGVVTDGNGGANYAYTYVAQPVGTIVAAAPAKLVFVGKPTATQAGHTIAPSVTVQVTDSYGNPTSTAGAPITISITSGTPLTATTGGPSILSGTLIQPTNGTGQAVFADLSIDTVGTGYQLHAAGLPYTAADSAAFNVLPSGLLAAVTSADSTFKNTDGFNVLFSKGATTTVMTLKNTDPGTFHYLLTLDNETGLALNSGNGAASATIITIPGVPTTGTNPVMLGSLTMPSSTAGLTDPAFTMQGTKSIRVHPDGDNNTDLPAQVFYAAAAPGGDCTATTVVWVSGQPGDGTPVKCVKVTGYVVPKRHTARVDLNLEFSLKNTPGWLAAQNPQLNFRAGFPFKAITTVTLDSTWGAMAGAYPGSLVTGIVGVGQAVTAVGGFVFDTSGNGIAGATVRLYNAPPSAANFCSSTGGDIARYVTTPDGFYFIAQTGLNDSTTSATGSSPLPSGIQYYVAVCNPAGIAQAYWPGRLISHKLANKEFDDEDFYVSSPSVMTVTKQPSSGKVGMTIGAIQVSVVDAFGYVVTGDNADTISVSAPAGSGLTGTLSAPVVSGVATFSNLKFSSAGAWMLSVSASPMNWGSGTMTTAIQVN